MAVTPSLICSRRNHARSGRSRGVPSIAGSGQYMTSRSDPLKEQDSVAHYPRLRRTVQVDECAALIVAWYSRNARISRRMLGGKPLRFPRSSLNRQFMYELRAFGSFQVAAKTLAIRAY